VPLGTVLLGTFLPLGTVLLGMFLPLGTVLLGTFLPLGTVLLGTFLPPGTVLLGTFPWIFLVLLTSPTSSIIVINRASTMLSLAFMADRKVRGRHPWKKTERP